MRAVVVAGHGGPEMLRLAERPDPRPGPRDVLVDIEVCGVNFIDAYHRSGYYPLPLPFVPGVEGVGRVVELGADVGTEVAVGERVGWVMAPGSYAERIAVPLRRLVPIPAALSTEIAAACLLQGLTAHYLTNQTYPVRPGDTVLVHAAAGGVGLLLTQLVKLKGGRVIGTVSTEEKGKLALEAGADQVIRYTEPDFADEVRRLTDRAGVAVVYDGVGQATFDGSLASLGRHGTMVQYGQASGPVPPFDLKRLADGGSLYLTRPAFLDHMVDRAELVRRTGEILDLAEAGTLAVHIGGRYPLSDAAAVHRELLARRTSGKLLLVP